MKTSSKKPHRKHKVSSPDLKQITNLIIAKTIMTHRDKFVCCQPGQNVSDAIKTLSENRFSGAPLEEEPISRYVKLEKLQRNVKHALHCGELAIEIGPNDKISENTTIESLIEVLAERKDPSPLFVVKDDAVTGLVTCADLDKIAVKVYFFVLLSAFESLLLDVIGSNYEKYKTCLRNPKTIEKRYRRCQGEFVGLDEHNYLMTKEIFEVVWKSEIKTIISVTNEEELKKLAFFRNKVAHGNYIIIKDDDVNQLKEINEVIRGYLKSLERI